MNVVVKVGDITKEDVDAIVNAANETLLGGGGVDGAIHAAAGPELREECLKLSSIKPPNHQERRGIETLVCVKRGDEYVPVRCITGEVRITSGSNLPANYIVHTVGPRCLNDEVTSQNRQDLYACWTNAIDWAGLAGISTIAFPSISTGVFGYPVEEAAAMAISAIFSFDPNDVKGMELRIVCFSEKDRVAYQKALDMKKSLVKKSLVKG